MYIRVGSGDHATAAHYTMPQHSSQQSILQPHLAVLRITLSCDELTDTELEEPHQETTPVAISFFYVHGTSYMPNLEGVKAGGNAYSAVQQIPHPTAVIPLYFRKTWRKVDSD